MNTRKITYGGVYTAMIIALGLTIFYITGTMGLQFYADMACPILIGVLSIICGTKVATIGGGIATLLVMFYTGDFISTICMLQSLFIGVATAKLITSDTTIMDDILISALIGVFVMLAFDVVTATLFDISVLDTDDMTKAVADMLGGSQQMLDFALYLAVSSIPIGTVIISYIGIMFIVNRLGIRVEENQGKRKIKLTKDFRKIYPYCYLSRGVNTACIVMIAIEGLLLPYVTAKYPSAFIYVSIIVIGYFVLMDYFKLISYHMVMSKRPAGASALLKLSMIGVMCMNIIVGLAFVIVSGLVIDKKQNYRKKTKELLQGIGISRRFKEVR